MSEEGNPFLRHARSMTFDTPEKSSLPEVKVEKEEKPSPSASPSPKKLCTSSEKFFEGLTRGYLSDAGIFGFTQLLQIFKDTLGAIAKIIVS